MKYEYVALNDLELDPNNVRSSLPPEKQAELLVSLRDNGQLVALICYMLNGRYIVFDGRCRLDALRKLGWEQAWVCILDKKPDAAELLIAQIHVNGRRQELNPVDLMIAYRKVMELKKLTPTQLAAVVGVEPPKVTPILALAKLDNKQRELVRAGTLPLSTAYALARMEPDERENCVQRILAGELKRDQVQSKARKQSKGEQVKTRRVCCELSQGKVTVTANNGLSLSSLIELLDGLLRQCKKARTSGWDIMTAVRVMRDTSRVTNTSQPPQ